MSKRELISRSELARRVGVSAASITRNCAKRLQPACYGKRIDANHPVVIEYAEQLERERTASGTGIDPYYEDALEACRKNNRYSIKGLQDYLPIGFHRAKKIYAMMESAGLIPAEDEEPPVIEEVKKPPRVIKGHTKRNNEKKTASLENLGNGAQVHEVPENIIAFADMTLREIIQQFGSDYAFLDWLKAMKTIEDIDEKRLKNAQTRGELVNRDLIMRGVIEPINNVHTKLLTDGAKALARRVPVLHDSGKTMEEIETYISKQLTSFIRPVKSKIKKAIDNA